MSLERVLNDALSLIGVCAPSDAQRKPKAWFFADQNVAYVVDEFQSFAEKLEETYKFNPLIAKRFGRKTIYSYVEKRLVATKKAGGIFSKEDASDFFQTFLDIKAKSIRVLAPISGIRLDQAESCAIGIFEVGYEKNLEWPLSSEEDGMFVSVPLHDVYDNTLAFENAKANFEDFVRLIVFLAGRYDGLIALKIGLPRLQNVGPMQMRTEAQSYVIVEVDGSPSAGNHSNPILERLPVNADFFANSPDFSKVIKLYGMRQKGDSITEMEGRIVNAALAIGESLRTTDKKNAIIYSCIALETLFSYDDGSLFQKSIGDRLADAFAFFAGTDLESRLEASKLVKRVYRMRSALVHGGDKNALGEHFAINQLNRAVVRQLLNDERFAKVTKIDHLYDMIKRAHYSYDRATLV
jgi:hypothetical protein